MHTFGAMHRRITTEYLPSQLAVLCLCLIVSFAVQARTLVMGTSNGPPYMIQATDSGLDIDIPREALKRMGYDLSVRYASLARAQMEVQSRRIDLMAPLAVSGVDGVFMSEPYIYYRAAAFSLKKNHLTINNVRDLQQYRVMTFQGAKGYFGEEFVEAVRKAPLYSEIYKLSLLPRLLFAGRTDVVVLDYYIFKHFSHLLEEQNRLPELFVHDIFPRVPASVAFHNKALRDEFNRGLAAIKRDGTYDQILQKYNFSNR